MHPNISDEASNVHRLNWMSYLSIYSALSETLKGEEKEAEPEEEDRQLELGRVWKLWGNSDKSIFLILCYEVSQYYWM